MSGKLTEEQLKRIEENRRKALAKRAGKGQCTNIQNAAESSHTSPGINKSGNETKSSFTSNTSREYTKPTDGNKGNKSAVYGTDSVSGFVSVKNSSRNSISKTHEKLVSGNNLKGPVVGINKTHSVLSPPIGLIKKKLSDGNNAKETNISNASGKSAKCEPGVHAVVLTKNNAESRGTRDDASRLHGQSVTNDKQMASRTSDTQINLDRIEQNRLKALAKRAEKINKSPGKTTQLVSNIYNSSVTNKGIQQSTLTNSVNTLSNNVSSNFTSSAVNMRKENIIAQNCTNNESSSSGQNIFSKFAGTPVKGGCFLVSRDRFEVKVGYSAPLIELFKTMKTKMYDAVTKKWSFGLSEYNSFINAVRNLRPAVDIEPFPKAILTVFSAQFRGDNSPRKTPMADLSRVEQSLVSSLMSFQREGVNYGINKNGRVLIADDMGLGKTIQAICLSCYYRTEWPLLVVVPSSVRFDWAQRWVPSLDPQCINVVVTGKDSCTSGLINILSYDLMARKADELKKKRFQIVIMDESHLLKNFKTARCKAALPLLQNARRVLLLSGTPALSRPSELFTQIDAVCPYLFKFHDFGVRYCAGNKLPWGWDYSGSSNMSELQIVLEEKIMIRRLKKEVLTELPDKIRQMILLDPSSIKITKDLKTASLTLASGNLKKMEERGALLDFFHKSGTAKMKAIKSYVDDLLDSEKKFLIFAHHGDVLDGIEEIVRSKIDTNYIRIDGKTISEQRNILCKKFQLNEETKVAILSITAANAGLNLSSACMVVFAELFWNPGILVQAEDRAHRIGQQDMVNVQYLVARGTSDDHIWPMIQKKLDVLGKAGLSKDNFSSAETTRLTDQRQEEITKFLEESFCEDGVTSPVDDDDDRIETEKSPKKALKQSSILKYTSPCKDIETFRVSNTPPKCDKPSGLFKYFSSPKKNSMNNNNIGEKSILNSKGQSSRQDEKSILTCRGQSSRPGEGYQEDDDLEKFLMDSDEEWVGNDDEPVVKKRKT